MQPIFVDDCDVEPTVIKKAHQFISFKFGDIQLLDIMKFLGGATDFNPPLKACKTSETRWFIPYEKFDHHDKMQNTELTPYEAFYSKTRSCYPLETEGSDFVILLKRRMRRMTTEEAVVNLKLSMPLPTGVENYHCPQQLWKQQQMCSFKDFCADVIKKMLFPIWRQCKK